MRSSLAWICDVTASAARELATCPQLVPSGHGRTQLDPPAVVPPPPAPDICTPLMSYDGMYTVICSWSHGVGDPDTLNSLKCIKVTPSDTRTGDKYYQHFEGNLFGERSRLVLFSHSGMLIPFIHACKLNLKIYTSWFRTINISYLSQYFCWKLSDQTCNRNTCVINAYVR